MVCAWCKAALFMADVFSQRAVAPHAWSCSVCHLLLHIAIRMAHRPPAVLHPCLPRRCQLRATLHLSTIRVQL